MASSNFIEKLPGFKILSSFLLSFSQFHLTFQKRELKRLENISRSPLYAHFSESLSGIAVIRAFGLQTQFIDSNRDKIDFNMRASFLQLMAQRWLALRLEIIGAFLILSATIFAVVTKGFLSSFCKQKKPKNSLKFFDFQDCCLHLWLLWL